LRKEVHYGALLFDFMDTFENIKNGFQKIILPMSLLTNRYFLIFPALLLFFCSEKEKESIKLYELLDKERTGIDFNNNLEYNEKFNPLPV
jgi:hypothetical protein